MSKVIVTTNAELLKLAILEPGLQDDLIIDQDGANVTNLLLEKDKIIEQKDREICKLQGEIHSIVSLNSVEYDAAIELLKNTIEAFKLTCDNKSRETGKSLSENEQKRLKTIISFPCSEIINSIFIHPGVKIWLKEFCNDHDIKINDVSNNFYPKVNLQSIKFDIDCIFEDKE